MKRSFRHFFILFILAGFSPQGADCVLLIKGEEVESTLEKNTSALRNARRITIKGEFSHDGFQKVPSALKFNKKLEYLGLINNKLHPQDGLYLRNCLTWTNLSSFKLKGALDGAVLCDLKKGLKERALKESPITSLSLVKTNDAISKGDADIIAEILGESKTFTSLKLRGMGPQVLDIITPSKLDRSPEFVSPLRFLTSLYLRSNNLGNEGIEKLSEAFIDVFLTGPDEKGPLLTKLDLYDNNIGPEGVISLSKIVVSNGNLTDLGLGKNNLGDEGIRELAEYLQHKSITTLDVSENAIEAEGASHLANSLGKIGALTKLNVSDNAIGAAGAAALAGALTQGCSITSLDVSGNDIGDAGVQSLAKASSIKIDAVSPHLSFSFFGSLSRNASITFQESKGESEQVVKPGITLHSGLQYLNLSNNKIGPSGATALANALTHKDTALTHLIANGNNMGAKGLESLASALESNKKLIYLNIRKNNLTHESLKFLEKTLKHNHTLKELEIEDEDIALNGLIFNHWGFYPAEIVKALLMKENCRAFRVEPTIIDSFKESTSLYSLTINNKFFGIKDKNYLAYFRILLGDCKKSVFSTFNSIWGKAPFWNNWFRWKA